MNKPNFLALAASFAIVLSAIGAFHSTSTVAAPLTEINGSRVTDLAPVVVHANAIVASI